MTRALMTCVLFAIALPACSPSRPRQAAGAAEQLRVRALQVAQRDHRHVLLWFINNDTWSERLAEFHADSDVARILSHYFVMARVHADETPGGLDLYFEMGQIRGLPAFSILDRNGALLADSGGDAQLNIGFPVTPEELATYRKLLRAVCPEMPDYELDLLDDKLLEVNLRHEPQ